MALLKEKDQEHLRNEFKNLKHEVKLILFTQDYECDFCRETRQIINEVVDLSDKLTVEIYDFVQDSDQAIQYQVDKIPATIVMAGGETPVDYGIRYYGIPSGYEFSSLIQDIMMVGLGESGLSIETKSWLKGLTAPLHLQVFVTPTCPYCPQAVILSHKMAMESPFVTADMVEATEFPHLSNKYGVMGVPRTVINEGIHMEGAAPEDMLLAKMQTALVN